MENNSAHFMQAQRLMPSDTPHAAQILAAAFLAAPPITHLFAHQDRLAAELRYFMHCNCDYAIGHGEAYATVEQDGVALWLTPGHTSMTLTGMWQSGMFAAPWRYGLRGLARILVFAHHVDRMHKRYAPMPHYYLFLTGVLPGSQRQGVCNQLLAPMLARADRENRHVYLETQSETNVSFYRKYGFEVVGEAPFPFQQNFKSWAMLRQPV